MANKKVSDESLKSFLSRALNPDKLSGVNQKLMDMMTRKAITLHHFLMEALVCDYLLSNGCTEVDVEYPLGKNTKPPNLVIDVYGKSSRMTVGVEVETGHAPADALNPNTSVAARTIAKITRYSPYVNHFSLAIPPTYRPPLPSFFLDGSKNYRELMFAKGVTDQFYHNPPFDLEDFSRAKLSSIYIVDIDGRAVSEIKDRRIWQHLQMI